MDDLISRRTAIGMLCAMRCGCKPEDCGLTLEQDGAEECADVRWIMSLPSAQQWHVIEKRPMTEDERKEWSEHLGYDIEYEDAFLCSNLPDDGQEVIVCTSWGHEYVDKYADDGDGGYFEENGEIDGIVAWMPLPKPYKGAET